MAGRFDLGPLFRGVVDGLRKRRSSGEEPADLRARAVLLGVPVAAGIVVGFSGTTLPAADQFLAAAALFLGALLTVFGQVVTWRDRLAQRLVRTDRLDERALDEAAAHILLAVLITLITAIALVVRANLGENPCEGAVNVVARACAVVATAGMTYLVLIIWLVTNLLWDAYSKSRSWPQEDGSSS
jgi:hypothetical protein